MKKVIFVFLIVLTFCLVLTSAMAEETVLADNDKVYVKIKKLEASGDSLEMKVYLENKSNVTAMFSIDNMTVNGYLVDPFWAEEVAPGKKSNDTITVRRLSENGVTGDVSIIEFDLRAYDNNDWSAPDLYKDRISLYPLGEDKVSIVERKGEPRDLVVVNNDKLTIIVVGFYEDSIWGFTAKLYIVNKTDKTVMFSVDDGSVNGFMMNPFWAKELPPNARCYSDMHWSSSDFEENDITKVEEIELTFRVYDNNDWSAPDLFKETKTIKPW